MSLRPDQEKALREFEAWLRGRRMSPSAVTHYVGVVRRGLESGDILGLLRGSRSRGTSFVAHAALVQWARSRNDKALERRVAELPFLPHAPTRRSAMDPRTRSRIWSAAMGQPEPMRSFLELVIMGGRQVGDLFAAGRKDVSEIWKGAKSGPNGTHVAHSTAVLLGTPGWTTLGGLLSPAGYSASYAVLRRAIRKACAEARIPYVPPSEFRRLAVQEATDA